MPRLVVVCLASAFLGAIVGVWMFAGPMERQAGAQELPRGVPAGPGFGNGVPPPPGAPASAPFDPRDLEEFTPDERVNILVYEKANRSVVHITTKVQSPESIFNPDGFSDGAGSGSVLDTQGHILTNYHVIEDATDIRVTLHSGETTDAVLVGRDALSDIAVLKINPPASPLIPIELGDSSRLRVGQKVLAIGNPFGLERTLTVGTLSSLNRRLPTSRDRQLKSMIQIDAALNRGNSGGPLLNSQGRMIGMNTAILSPTGQNIGVGFAIPVNTIKRVVPQLIAHGRVIRTVIGIASVFISEQGLQIIEVTPGGPAERAGLKGYRVVKRVVKRGPFSFTHDDIDRSNADTIVSVDGLPVATGDALQEIIDAKRPGDQIILGILRRNQRRDVAVVLGASE